MTSLHFQPHSQPGALGQGLLQTPSAASEVEVRAGRVQWTGYLQFMASLPWILPEPNRHLRHRQPCVVLSCQSSVPAPLRSTHPKDQISPISALYTPQSCQTHLSGFSSTQ